MTTELKAILLDPGDHLVAIRELLEAYGPETVFDGGEYSHACLLDRTRLAAADIMSCLHDGRLRVFRAISVDADWTPSWLGRHWTTNPDLAYPHDGDGSNYVVIEALVDPDEIEVHRSVLLNMLTPDFWEAEILACDDAELEITSIRSSDGLPVFGQLWGTRARAIPEGGRPLDRTWRPPMTGKVFGGGR